MCNAARQGIFAVVIAMLCAGCGGGGGGVTPGGPHAPGGPGGPAVRDDWAMYAHDAHHTSASLASITGALKMAWRYDPQPLTGNTFSSSSNAVATVNGVYLHWQQYGSTVFAGGPSFDGISVSGHGMWSYCEHKDYDEGHWSSVFNNNLVFEDDGQQFLNVSSGAPVKTPSKKWSTSYDLWGESIPDPSGFYSANTFLADGADLFVYSLDSTGGARWTQNQQKSTKYSQDSGGGLLLSNGVLFYAAAYSDPTPFASGIYAFISATGTQSAFVATSPASEMSGDATNIYLIEGSNLVARAQSNLHAVWSVSAISSSSAAPVIANGLVIVPVGSGITAFNAGTGKAAWTSPVSPAFGGQFSTGMSAALGSNTLLVTANDGLHLLNLGNGSEIWHGTVAGAKGLVWNPVIVNDPARGAIVYVTDSRGVLALTQ